jgi:transposase-like protein
MPIPTHCSNPNCRHFENPPARWRVRFGSYETLAHGTVQRYRCTACGKTFGDQTESMHYYAKRRLPLKSVSTTLTGGSSMREVATRYRISPVTVQNAVLRLGRQAMISHLHLLDTMPPHCNVAFDGLRSFVTSQDYPCDITTVVSKAGEMILTMTHSITRRGGTMTAKQARRCRKKYAVWSPPTGAVKRAISLVCREILDYARYTFSDPITINTDEHPVYRSVLKNNRCFRHLRKAKKMKHFRTPGNAPRTVNNRLFPVNYVDRLLRHREKEHTRETIAFGRHGTVQMHRAWIFGWNHNCVRPWREKKVTSGSHAECAGVSPQQIQRLSASFYNRRQRVTHQAVPDSIREAFLAQIATPPVRWKKGQKGTTVRVPQYAVRDLLAAISTKF